MFYPVDSLRRGGRFYLCWVADSWPLRFAAITHRQLWSNDIRKLCQDLLEVMTNESGRPTHRFSLRLSSQLMRGLVRLYERKVTVLLADLCMINAHVFKSTNKKLVVHAVQSRPLRPLALPRPAPEEPEPRLEELIQNSGNAVASIQDITLKEAAIPDFQLPPNDGFGEEHPDQALRSLLTDRTVEVMLAQDSAVAHSSTLALPLESLDKSHDKSRGPHDAPLMDMPSIMDVTVFGKSTTDDTLPAFEKDFPATPALPPVPTESVTEIQVPEQVEVQVEAVSPQVQPEKQPVEALEDLEDLEAQPQVKKRRWRPKLIVDKKPQLASEYIRARIQDIYVETRCLALADPRAGGAALLAGPARRAGAALRALYRRNPPLEPPPADTQAAAEDVEQARQLFSRSNLERIIEVPEAQPEPPNAPANIDEPRLLARPSEDFQVPKDNINAVELNVTVAPLNLSIPPLNVTNQALDVSDQPLNVTNQALDVSNQPLNLNPPAAAEVLGQQDLNQMQVDISDLPTQQLVTLSQDARKRTSNAEVLLKRRRRESIYISEELDKENVPPLGRATCPQIKDVASMLQEAGLSEPPPVPLIASQAAIASEPRRKDASEGSETPLGSLDRTKVSLGDSVNTTDSQKFIRSSWGIEGTMEKIIYAVKAGGRVTVERLVREGPVIAGCRAVIAARCFTSVLKLKQHGFLRIDKNQETLEILDISLGPRFDAL